MNNLRRKMLRNVVGTLEEARDGVVGVLDEEQEAYDNLPEGLQASERGEAMSENVDILDEVVEEIDEVIEKINEICESK